jgi:hypothetical protein
MPIMTLVSVISLDRARALNVVERTRQRGMEAGMRRAGTIVTGGRLIHRPAQGAAFRQIRTETAGRAALMLRRAAVAPARLQAERLGMPVGLQIGRNSAPLGAQVGRITVPARRAQRTVAAA